MHLDQRHICKNYEPKASTFASRKHKFFNCASTFPEIWGCIFVHTFQGPKENESDKKHVWPDFFNSIYCYTCVNLHRND